MCIPVCGFVRECLHVFTEYSKLKILGIKKFFLNMNLNEFLD